jgi:hypothetical protein
MARVAAMAASQTADFGCTDMLKLPWMVFLLLGVTVIYDKTKINLYFTLSMMICVLGAG